MRIETLAVHASHRIDPSSKDVTPPIHVSTTFERAEDGSYPGPHVYSRSGNPSRADLEECLTALEGGVASVAFASGSAASMSVFQALGPGSHIIAPNDMYHGTVRILSELLDPWGLKTTFVDMTEPSKVEQAVESNTRLIWIETPSNPLLKVTDIARVADIAHSAGAICVCDGTWTTPVLQRPFEFGADLVVHATTKYLGGHSDVVGGAVVAKADGELLQRVRQIQTTGGAIPSPFDCWLVMRGIRTLPYRMRAHSENAAEVADFLSKKRGVEAVHYPGLTSHPEHDVAAQQMELYGGMLSFQVKGGRDEAMAVAAKVRLFTRATSLGGTESLIEHRASIEGPGTRTPENLLRLSVGLENPLDLIDDLDQALNV